MSRVDLGFSEECEPWQVESYLFPSKIGGKPAWLDLENLPTPEKLQCENCHQPTIFLCQIYAPFEENDDNFHRTVFIFICRNPKCCTPNSTNNIKAFRSSLKRQNKYYSYDPPGDKRNTDFSLDKWLKLCNLCGCLSGKQCSKCKKISYCSREHQIIDWKEGHKNECEKETTDERLSLSLFPQFEIVIEAEEINHCRNINESEELDKFAQMELEGKTGALGDVSESEIEKFAKFNEDKAFARFKKRIADNPDQILRYERGGEPLLISDAIKPEKIPNCEYCGSPRQYEFQIMPQILSILHDHELDLGVIIVYTCSKSCTGGDNTDNYKKEFVFKQDIDATNL